MSGIFVSGIESQVEYSTSDDLVVSGIVAQVEYEEGTTPPTDKTVQIPIVMMTIVTGVGTFKIATSFFVDSAGNSYIPGLLFPTIPDVISELDGGVDSNRALSLQIARSGKVNLHDASFYEVAENFDIRGSRVYVYSYDPVYGEHVDGDIEFVGVVDAYEIDEQLVTLQCYLNDSVTFDKMLPFDTVTAERFYASAIDIGAPINMPFGECRDIPCPNIKNDKENDEYWYLLGHSGIMSVSEVRRNGWVVDSSEYEFYCGIDYDYLKFTEKQVDFAGRQHSITASVIGFRPRYKTIMSINGVSFILPSSDPPVRHIIDVIKMLLTHPSALNDEFGVNDESFAAAKTALGEDTDWYININIGGLQRRAGDWLNDIMAYMPIHLYRDHRMRWCVSVDVVKAPTFFCGQNDGYYNNCKIVKRWVTPASKALKKVIVQYNFSESKLSVRGDKLSEPYNYEIFYQVRPNFGTEDVIVLPAVNSTILAKKVLSRLVQQDTYSGIWISLLCGPEFKSAKAGDVVRVYSSYYYIEYKDYIITSVSKDYSNKFQFEARGYDDRIYEELADIADPEEPVEATVSVSGPTAMPYKYIHVDGTVQDIELTPRELSRYVFGGIFNGIATADLVLCRHKFIQTVSFPAGMVGSDFYVDPAKESSAATAETTFIIKKYTAASITMTSIGSAVFAADGMVATFTFSAATTFVSGDIFYLIGPATADATLGDLSYSFLGVKESS